MRIMKMIPGARLLISIYFITYKCTYYQVDTKIYACFEETNYNFIPPRARLGAE